MRFGIASVVIGVGVEIVASVLPLIWENQPRWVLLTLFSIGGLLFLGGLLLLIWALLSSFPKRSTARAPDQSLLVEPRVQDHPRHEGMRLAYLMIKNNTGTLVAHRCAVKAVRLAFADGLVLADNCEVYLHWSVVETGEIYHDVRSEERLEVWFVASGGPQYPALAQPERASELPMIGNGPYHLTLGFSADNVPTFRKTFFLSAVSQARNFSEALALPPGTPQDVQFREVNLE